MTTIRLSAADADAVRTAEGRLLLCDPDGNPIREVELSAVRKGEPQYTAEQWRAIMDDPDEFTTAEVLAYAQSRGGR